MGAVTIRRASAEDALIVAALHLQLARERGMPSEQGFLDRFVDAWLGERLDRPTWIAECRGEHAGVLETRRVRVLPWPGRPPASWLHVGALFVIPGQRRSGIGRSLVEGMVEWARPTDVRWIRLDTPDPASRRICSRIGFGPAEGVMEIDLRSPS
jgi:GNAT superfamily N-acetyltransferase